MKKTLIHRSSPDGDFTCIPNALLRNKNLSNGARGLIVAILSNTEDWQVNSAYIRRICTDGAAKKTSQLQELEQHGYAVCHVLRNKWGSIKGQEWHFYDKPVLEKDRSTPLNRGGKRIRSFKGVSKTSTSHVAASRHFQKTITTKKTIRESKGLGSPSLLNLKKPVKVEKKGKTKFQTPAPKLHPAFQPPTSNELWEFVVDNNLETICKVKKLIFEELTVDNWHLWNLEGKWERVINWKQMLKGLHGSLYRKFGERLPDLPPTDQQIAKANWCTVLEYERSEIES